MYNHSTTYRQAILIKHLQILGERNSGTNYLASLIQKNIPAIDITNSFGFKHWFIKDHYPRTLPNNSTDMECTRSLDDSDDATKPRTLFDLLSPYSDPRIEPHIQNLVFTRALVVLAVVDKQLCTDSGFQLRAILFKRSRGIALRLQPAEKKAKLEKP